MSIDEPVAGSDTRPLQSALVVIPLDKILLKGIACQARVGVFEWERLQGCRCEIDLEISLDLAQAAQTDKLRYTLDYSVIHKEVVALAEGCRFSLMEKLAGAIASLVLEKPGVAQVRVVLKKLEVIGGGPLDYAAIDITRRTRASQNDAVTL